MNSGLSDEPQESYCPERELWFEVVKRALWDWQDLYTNTRTTFKYYKQGYINVQKQQLNWFFFEPEPQECNLSWICDVAAEHGEGIRAAVEHGLVHGIDGDRRKRIYRERK